MASSDTTGREKGSGPAVVITPERALVLLERVAAIYQKNLTEASEGVACLKARGITDVTLWDHHRIGYSNGKLTELLPKTGGVWDELKALGILLPNAQERLAGCVVFPVIDPEGRLLTICGLDPKAAEQQDISLPSRPTGIWNGVALKTYAHLFLVGSVLDGLSLEMAGSRNVVCIPGTNALSADHVPIFTGYGVQRITVVVSHDRVNQTTLSSLESLLSPIRCQCRELPENHGPNSYLLAHGARALRQWLVEVPPAAGQKTENRSAEPAGAAGVQPIAGGFALTLGLRRYEIRGLEKGPRKLKATVRIEYAGKLHVDTLDLYHARWRKALAQDLTRILEEKADIIEGDLSKLITACESLPTEQPATGIAPTPVSSLTPEARKEAEELGKRPDLMEQILADYERCGLVGERANKLLCYLTMTSRKLEKPLSVLILSSSGAGKTALQDAALLFCPPEDLVKLTSVSGKALFYKEQGSLKHKVLALEEGDGAEAASYALRNLISAGQLVSEATIKDQMSGKLKTMENRVEGPTAVFVTTTDPDTDPETRSRFFVTSVDESREQTQAILISQRQRQTLAGLADSVAQEPTLRKHHNFQRLLRTLPVVNRYAAQLTYGDSRLQSRRDQPKYFNLINAVALLRQLQKEVKSWTTDGLVQPYIEVDREDIRVANDLITQLMGQSLDELSRPGFDLLQQLERLARQQIEAAAGNGAASALSFTRRQVREATGWGHARVHRYLRELVQLEYVLVESGRSGVQHRYRLAYDGQGQDGSRFVLGLKPVEELKD